LPSSLEFGAFLVYPPNPVDACWRDVKNFILGLKQDRVRGDLSSSQYVARRMREELEEHELLALFEDALLVPVPKSAPLTAGALWASDRIAKAMCHAGFGRDVAPLVERVRPVATSHLSAGSERAWPDQHRDSVTVGRDLPVGFAGRLVLVDDVVTRGSTLLSCALALLETYPQAEVTGFAVARTVKGGDELPESTVQPVLGTIDWRPGWIERTP